MIKVIKISILLVMFIAGTMSLCSCFKKRGKSEGFAQIKSYADIVALFPDNAAEIATRTTHAIEHSQKMLDAMLAVAPDQRNYNNTGHVLDVVMSLSDLAILGSAFSVLEMVSPQEAVRTAAHDAVQKINDFNVDALSNNVAIYTMLNEYVRDRAAQENLTEERRYFLTKLLEDLQRGGLELPESERAVVGTLKKELAKLSQEFEVNIAQDNRTITVDRQALAGLKQEFIDTLPKSGEHGYVLGVDYPTYTAVMEDSSVEATRKKLYRAFNNRAYPVNKTNLNLVIAKRDELAHMLGFDSFAAYDLADQMVESPERAEKFLRDLLQRATVKYENEFHNLVRELPESVQLTADGKINPWDLPYVKNQYKKKHFNLDETAIAEYFPMQKTIDGLLDIYQQFFGLEFKEVNVAGLWHEDVRVIEAYDAATHKLLGYLLLDLYPRPNKFSHACNATIVPAVMGKDGEQPPMVSLVIANFPKPTDAKPSLLKKNDVNTFFHEFGHALHGLLGRTHVGSMAGTAVKSDFVELPSQMLEEWLWDKDILKKISSHYTTGEPMPDELINKILETKNFDSGFAVVRQIMFALLSLDYYKQGMEKDLDAIMQDLARKTVKHSVVDPENHFYASFGHLMGYSAKYYGYLWSKVFALDLFNEIKKHGLLNPEIGKKYVTHVIGKGGSQDPNMLLKNFLGREPNQTAFLKDLGL